MDVRLLHSDREFAPDTADRPLAHSGDLTDDLELDTLLAAMDPPDEAAAATARAALLAPLRTPDEIRYRQRVHADALAHESAVRELHTLAADALERERRLSIVLYPTPESVLRRAVNSLDVLTERLRALRRLAARLAAQDGWASEGFTGLFAELDGEVDDDWFREVARHLKELQFRRGILLSARLGDGGRATELALGRPDPDAPDPADRKPARRFPLGPRRPDTLSFTLPENDDRNAKALEELRDRGLNSVADAVATAADHLRDWFAALHRELGFHLCLLNLRKRLADRGLPLCTPEPLQPGTAALAARDLYDPGLALTADASTAITRNDVEAGGAPLILVTGANQGGKSTFLRSVGTAQLLLQCGAFAPAAEFRAEVRTGLFTHYRRREDATMTHGKLEEELARMSGIADVLAPGALLLCNESFAATNEREGSEIAREILTALTASGVRIVFVTHLFALADGFGGDADAVRLRAERRDDGTRTFRIVPGDPLPTSHGEDVYKRVFGTAGAAPHP
ncbi:hypothetical protein BIV57_09315 [Mangrovactinospora gilvigrisea]|uniref:DNA mismatch repair proteins mutS family domain-containing protein n=1 Tax=Mangrovactinospora gilvigrisea TaxID=1428644 RepID=A0A1J7C8A7_9ACTN|nr:hypothetical protein [Mangrovactinospora gilvigrisea]OIV37760.1 hypothetical protein BIV57_09315 [Mangrovactinospora gilvigrisea]